MSDELYMDASPKNTKNCILVCEESYKLLQQENAELRQAKEKAEAEVELLRKNWISLARQILAEHDRDGWCRLVVPKESAQNMLNVLEEKDGEG
jgi:cell division protein FtsB